MTQLVCLNTLLGSLVPWGTQVFSESHSPEAKAFQQWRSEQPTVSRNVIQGPNTQQDLEKQLTRLVFDRVAWSAQQGFDRATERTAYRHREMTWLRSHSAELTAHRGKWVVLEGQRILASEGEYGAARQQAVLAGIHRPLIFLVPDDDADAFMGL